MKKRCCFTGHSEAYLTDEEYTDLLNRTERLITEENVSEFWVGNYGNFDGVSANAIKKLKEKYPYIQLNLVIPYLTTEINKHKDLYYNRYDNILMADLPERTPKKFLISKCNEYMVNNSDFIICYIRYAWGGAAKTYEYAKRKKHIKIFNIAQRNKEI